ncbi:LytR C-terminal domain-containing protein [Kocuria sp. TGY1127_2]|uniref:LytR C-terminal domain-containing protein n=1 Tax=Kocuria sp. TGY1127_2 TaxID=2711328 RepID=UPI0015BFD9C8|nr:LytR C-terminal domain-containing protein [Kocuria sp. TGY1127_2]
MAEYEHDEFDDVPVDSPRRGAYRGELPEKSGGFKQLAALIVAGICALIIGGVFFLLSPKLASPDAASSSASSSSSQEASDSGSASESPSDSESGPGSDESSTAKPDASTTLGVYNYSSKEGTATKAATTLTDAGWTVSDVSNWDGQAQKSSVVYYAQGHDEQAKAIAQKLDIKDVKQAAGYSYQVVVVLSEGDGANSSSSGGSQGDSTSQQ